METDQDPGGELIDEALLSSLRASSGATVLSAMIHQYVEQGDIVLERMRGALDDDDLQGVGHFARQLAGMAEAVAGGRVGRLARRLEELTLSDARGEALHQCWHALVGAHQQTCAALRARFAGL